MWVGADVDEVMREEVSHASQTPLGQSAVEAREGDARLAVGVWGVGREPPEMLTCSVPVAVSRAARAVSAVSSPSWIRRDTPVILR